ncbi:TrbI/VirB10 family protein [Rubrivirga sp. S365]|uniref:TrbI/VirB10 family protein n=1 Tax=Rubrivirga sp. S365 TaxID=3076080 RepID=UPI0028CAD81A|nr:TrbI/VirB10 family protein [Rubrivirga sp. S365]MDT7858199.1 TrbI/VirB10 family protein [Rubrivirga sp. S365]
MSYTDPDTDSTPRAPVGGATYGPPSGVVSPSNGAAGHGPTGAGEPPRTAATSAEAAPADVLDPATDGRTTPVGLDRKVVLAGLAIVGTVFCLLLLMFAGDDEVDVVAQAPPPTSPPGAYIDEQTADYYGDMAADPTVPVAGAPAGPYGPDPYGGDPYATGSYPASGPDYATTQPYSPPPVAAGAPPTPARPTDPSRDAFERAVASPLLVGSSQTGAPRAPTADPAFAEQNPEYAAEMAYMKEVAELFPTSPPPGYGPGAAAPAAAPPPAAAPTAAPTAGLPAGPGTRSAFLDRTSRSGSGGSQYGAVVRPTAARALTLRAGSVVPAALVTGMNSDLPGTVIAQVTRNVYDSGAQRDVLIPAGTRLVGEYDDQIAYGQGRALVAWSRMLFPDGSSVELPGLPGVDLQGYSGLTDEVDRHYARLFGSAVMLAAVGVGVELASPDQEVFGGAPSPQEVASRQVAIELSRVATEVIKRQLDVQPTIKVSPGYRFYVLLARDLTFAGPYRPRPDVGRFPRR